MVTLVEKSVNINLWDCFVLDWRLIFYMKIAFSTLGCPGWSWDEIVSTAKDLGYDGIEVRGIGSELHAPDIKEFSDEKIDSTLERLKNLELEIPCLTSSCFLFEKDRMETNLKEGREYVDLAQRLGVPFVRVLGDRDPGPGEEIDFQVVKENVSELVNYSSDKGVKILVETNGFFADPAQILKLLDAVNSDNLGVLWDIHHPFRYMDISVKMVYNELKNYIFHVHSENRPYYNQMKDFLEYMEGATSTSPVSLEYAAQMVKLVEMAKKSHEKQASVEL
jgi:sugar phosphate isomerase/epimerase